VIRSAIYMLAALATIISRSTFATSIRVDFAGSVASITGYDASGAQVSEAEAAAALGGSIGTRFSGYVIYDDAAALSDFSGESLAPGPGQPPFPNVALYLSVVGQSYSTVGNFVTSGGFAIQVSDNEQYLQNANPSVVEFEGTGFFLYATGPSPGAPLHSTSLVGIPWSLENFPNSTVHWSLYDSVSQLHLYPIGSIDYLVPEPAALGMVAFAAYSIQLLGRHFCRRRDTV